MNTSGNTILITGGGSGIGLALAEEFKKLGNEVIVAGRSQSKLEIAKAKGMHVFNVDMNSSDSVQKLAADVIYKFRGLNVVVHNAGIMVNEKLTTGNTSSIAEDTVRTNLLGPILLTNALLPHFLRQKSATIITVTSGLAFAPLVMTPTYSATKAAIHSYTQSLRWQLKGTSVEVKELVPPYVQTELMGERQAKDPNAMPLRDFISEVISILKSHPEAEEILVEKVKPQRNASHHGAAQYNAFFTAMNERLMAARKQEWDKL